VASVMKNTPSLVQVRPRDHQRYREIPIFGRLLDDFVPWAFGRGYTIHTVYLQLDSVRHLGKWFRKQGRHSLGGLTEDDLTTAHRCFSTRRRDPRYAWGLRGFIAFLQALGHLKLGRPNPSAVPIGRWRDSWSICARIVERRTDLVSRTSAASGTF